MSIGVTFPSAGGQSGSNYTVPEPGDVMTQSLTDYLVAIASKGLALPTSADLDLGATFGIKAVYFKTRTANPAASGVVRLANADTLAFRNAANSGDLALAVDAGNALTFAGANVTGNPMLAATTIAAQSLTSAITTIIVFGTVERDSDSAYNSGTGRFTVPAGRGGDYTINAAVTFTNAISGSPTIGIFKNAINIRLFEGNTLGAGVTMPVNATVNLVAGDIVDIRVLQSTGGAQALAAIAALNYFSLKRIPT